MPQKVLPSLAYEHAFWRDGFTRVAGLDEAGRGALAGPVVAAAVILPPLDSVKGWRRLSVLRTLAQANDSKQLTPLRRERLFDAICGVSLAFAVGMASPQEIDSINILRASYLAMYRALHALSVPPDALLLDALVLPEMDVPQQGIIHGDALALSISAASILAKVTRDRLMSNLDVLYPQYGFAAHKGYGTPEHLAGLRAHGPSPEHRFSYEPVRLAVHANG